MESINSILEILWSIDVYLGEIIKNYGYLTYLILFLIIFSENGVFFLSFLPGNTLLFTAGAFASIHSLNPYLLLLLLVLAAIVGNAFNYWTGYYFGKKIISNRRFPINPAHLERTQKFYDKYGKNAILLARFFPYIRGFTPFLAGIGKMNSRHFYHYSILGGIVWISSLVFLGYFFGKVI